MRSARRIVERLLGHRLPRRAEVHHFNRDPTDNRPQNLVVCENRAYHMLLHARHWAKVQAGRPDFENCDSCSECGWYKDPAKKGWCNNCRRKTRSLWELVERWQLRQRMDHPRRAI